MSADGQSRAAAVTIRRARCRWQTGIDRIKGRGGQRNVPSNPSALYNKALFWDGRSTTLEQHAFLDQDIQTLA
jgi:cytochrome c peroxidase